MDVKYPEVHVQLTGKDGNAFAILGTVKRALDQHLRTTDMTRAERDYELERFMIAATSGDYDNLLRVCMEWVEVS